MRRSLGLKITGALGRGSFGRVWRARARDGTQYALKAVPLRRPREQLSEARLMAGLSHPNLVRYHGSWIEPVAQGGLEAEADAQEEEEEEEEEEDKGETPLYRLLIQMELVPGGTLREWLRVPLAARVPCAASVFGELAGALAYLHSRAVAHLDVKPENVLLGSDGRVRLADLGMAARVGERRRRRLACGTPPYAAPEMRGDEEAEEEDPRAADVYSLGVCAVEMSYEPFRTAMERARAIERALSRSPMLRRDPRARPAAAAVAWPPH